MSDFFSQLGANIRFPDAKINGSGPLPTSLSGPAGINGDPDGNINFNSDLLSGITPYAYEPGQGRMGSDRNYQQIPHRIQKIVPKLFLPYADEGNSQSCLALSHAVDQGDVAFILQTSRVQSLIYDSVCMRDASIANLQIPGHTAFINISTVNYLLAGLQRLTAQSSKTATWAMLAGDLGYRYQRGHTRADVLELVSTRLVPFGICAGSENQGGKHETGLAPVQAAANHVTTLTVDGQNRDLVNLWRNVDISAGDELIFKLAWMPTHHYVLNHYYKGIVRQTFVRQRHCWQLVPAVFEMQSPLQPATPDHWAYDYRIHGYWRIAQCFQHRSSYEADQGNVCDDTNFLRGQLLQVTFAPVWMQFQALNAPDPDQPPAKPEPRRDPPSSQAAVPDSRSAKRSYIEAFQGVEAAASCAVLGPAPASKICEISGGKRWNLSSSAVGLLPALPASGSAAAPVAAMPAALGLSAALPLSAALGLSAALETNAARRVPVAAAQSSARESVPPPPAPAKRTVAGPTPTGAKSTGGSVAARAVDKRPAQGASSKGTPQVAAVGAVEAGSVAGRPFASIAALGTAMSQIPADTGLPAPAADRTVKNVLVKNKSKKTSASPPAASPRSPP